MGGYGRKEELLKRRNSLLPKLFKIRLVLFSISLILLLLGLVVRLCYIQVIQHSKLREKAERQHLKLVELEPKRGIIYDRNNQELAITIASDSLYAVPYKVQDRKGTALKISQVVKGLSYKEVLNKLNSGHPFVWIKRKLSAEESEGIRKLNSSGLGLIEESKRFYPKREIASHVLGFVGIDNQGLEGLELFYDSYLKGTSGWMIIERDSKGREIFPAGLKLKVPLGGYSLYLTLDERIQHTAERELEKAVERYEAKGGSLIAIDPRTGEILAIANIPGYNPNSFENYEPWIRKNRALTDIFEPGSTFKVIMAAGALEEGRVVEAERFRCREGEVKIGDRYLHDPYPSRKEWLTFREVLEVSSNIGAVQAGWRLGKEKLYSYISSFGFGSPTGIDLPGEARGVLKSKNNWSKISLSAISLGQEVSVTPLQLAVAFAAIANKGQLMRPYIVRAIRDGEGRVIKVSNPTPVRQVISPRTAERLLDIMRGVVRRGSGQGAYIEGYDVAGKTGTAQKPDPKGGGYASDKFVSSFVGIVPASKPQLVILVVIDEPKETYWGGDIAAPLFKRVATEALRYLNIPPDKPEERGIIKEEMGKVVVLPNLRGLSVDDAWRILTEAGLRVKLKGRGPRVVDQIPEAGARLKGKSVVELIGGSELVVKNLIIMPNLLGSTMRQALNLLALYQLEANLIGSGIAVEQEPLPGKVIKKGERCLVRFAPPS